MVFKVYLDASQFSEMYMLERLLFIYLWMHPETWEPQPCRLCRTLIAHFPHKTNLGRFGTKQIKPSAN
jgi:hypothetical protein